MKVTLWLDRKIDARVGFHELTHTLFFWRKIDPASSIYELEIIGCGKLNRHYVVLQPYLKQVAL